MQLLAGTSGFSYKEWVGEFYPDKLPAEGDARALRDALARSSRSTTRSIACRTRRRSKAGADKSLIRFGLRSRCRGASRTSNGCAIAAPRSRSLLTVLADLGPCLGSLLVQLPPHARCDEAALEAFLGELPCGSRVAFEFRNDTWHVPAVFALLESRNAALVQSESDETFEPLPWTADWAYLRLRRVDVHDRGSRALARAHRGVRSRRGAGLFQARGRCDRAQARGRAARHGGAQLTRLPRNGAAKRADVK